MPDTLYLVDGHSHIYQAFYAIRNSDLFAPDGQPVNAAYGFALMLRRILRRKPTYIAVVFDTGAPTFRHEQYKEYKANRPPMPDDLAQQIPLIREIVDAYDISVVELPGYEADDLIGTLAKRASKRGIDTLILTRDKDALQLLDEHIAIYDNKKDVLVDAEALRQTKDITPAQVVEYLALAGDSTDNVPGVPGIGEKTALTLIQQFGSMEAVFANIEKVRGPKMRENLQKYAQQASLSRRLVTIDTAAPVEDDLEKLRYKGENRQQLLALFKRLAFRSFLKDMVISAEDRKATYNLVATPSAFKRFLQKLEAQTGFALDLETTSTFPLRAEVVGLAFAWEAGEGFYLPVRAPLGEKMLALDEVVAKLKPILESPKIDKWGQNLKYDALVLRNHGVRLGGISFDAMIASYVLDPSRRRHNLDELAAEHLSYKTTPISDLIGKGRKQKRMDEVPTKLVAEYAGEDAEVSLRLKEELGGRLEDQSLQKLYQEVELPLLSVLEEMEWQGIRVNPEPLADLGQELEARLERLSEDIFQKAGKRFNIGSPKQLQEVLFKQLRLPTVKKTKTGYSTDNEVLQELAYYHELPSLVFEHRQLSKLKSTYVEALPRMVHPRTGRIHASFNQTVTATGRLSSSDPNLQNIPTGREPTADGSVDPGGRIREAFIPEEGHQFLSADYSQIELRLLAHFSQDERLLDAFARGEDIHNYVAAQIYGVDGSEVTPRMRRVAKAVNFGIIYGLSPYGLSRTIRVSVEDATKFIEGYYQRHPGVEKLLEDILREAKEKGYVSTILGRRRQIGGIRSTQGHNLNASERAAINTVMQGSAADLIKVAMINIHRRIGREKRPSRMLLQIHDELLFEVPESDVQKETEVVAKEMTEALHLRVPVEVHTKAGRNWLEVT